MTSTTRLLRLLALLPARPVWTGAALAERLEVTPRTVRRDVTRLRELGYPVQAEPGPAGGYRWLRGEAMPPLLLDDDEAVAVVLALRSAVGGAAAGLDDALVTALAKLQQVLPRGLGERVRTVDDATVRMPGPALEALDTTALMVLAQGCRTCTAVQVEYVDREGASSRREVEPLSIVHAGRRWFLVAWDVTREDWRTFRLDRVASARPTERGFRRDDPPDPLDLVARGTALAPYRLRVEVRVEAGVEDVRQVVPRTVGEVHADGDATRLVLGSSTPEWVGGYLGTLPFTWEVLGPPEVRDYLVGLGVGLARRHGG